MTAELVDTSNEIATHEAKHKRSKSIKATDKKRAKDAGVSSASVKEDAGDIKDRKKRKTKSVDEQEEEPVEKTRKKRHREEVEHGTVLDDGGPLPSPVKVVHEPEQEKKRRDKGKKREDVAGAVVGKESGKAGDDDSPRDKKKRKDKKSVDVTEDTIDTSEKKKKRKKVSDASAATEPEHVENAEKGKERKRKKRKHSKHGFPDPNEDEEITDQAKKGLAYAYQHAEDPDEWKFSKARQNWLVRNIWSDTTVPEKYVPLVTRYLSTLQGGAREAFIKTCRDSVASEAVDAEVDSRSGKDAQSADAPKTSNTAILRQRANDLLQALTGTEDT